jgi:hypothetical protein
MSTLENYLNDLGFLLKQEATDAKQQLLRAGEAEKAFCEGRLLAYHEVLSLVLSEAAAFGIDPEILRLKGFDPDSELT